MADDKGLAMNNFLADHDQLFITQEGKLCCQLCECLTSLTSCCGLCEFQEETEFAVRPFDSKKRKEVLMFAKEESGCCSRLCCAKYRSFTMNVHEGKDEKAPPTFEYYRPCRCLPGPMKCCCRQEMEARLAQSEGDAIPIGKFTETFYWCTSQFNVEDMEGTVLYKIHPPTMCCGTMDHCCPEAECSKCKLGCCRIPFYLYKPDDSSHQVGKIVKVWGGLATELFTDADKFECHFPEASTPNEKAIILGGVFLINQLFFEGGEDDKDAV
jgi:hypothetical protein